MSSSVGGGARDPRNAARRATATRRGRRVRVPCLRRSAASITLLVAGILFLTASFTAWWTLSISGGGAIGFFPGDYFGGSIAFGKEKAGAETYEKGGLGSVAGLYELVLGLVLAIATLVVVGGIVGLAAEKGKFRRRARGPWVGLLGLLGFLFAVSVVIVAGVAQPTQLQHATFFGLCGAITSGSTPCHTFSGSGQIGSVKVTWNPGFGFYATIFASLLALGGAITWWSAREELWEEEVPADGGRGPARFGTQRPMSLRDTGRYGHPGHSSELGPEAWTRGGVGARRAAMAPGRPNGTPAAGRPRPGASGPTTVGASRGSPPTPPEAPAQPPVDLSGGSEIQVITQLKERLDSGQLSSAEYARWKSQLLAIPPEAFPAQQGSGELPHQELHELDALRDAGAISGQEYLQLRRRLLLRT